MATFRGAFDFAAATTDECMERYEFGWDVGARPWTRASVIIPNFRRATVRTHLEWAGASAVRRDKGCTLMLS